MSKTVIANKLGMTGFVYWELTDEHSGKKEKSGDSNVITNHSRERLATALLNTAITWPNFIGVGTGTSTPSASDTGLQTVFQYDGANDAKTIDSKSVRSLYTSRLVVQFSTTQANTTIRELGLLDAANGGNLWARVSVNITKTSSQRLTVYWYITFNRSIDVALKTGASINATGTISAATATTLTFASTVTVVIIYNNSGEKLYFKINEALDGANPPVDYDFALSDGELKEFLNEEIAITTVSVFGATISGAMPLNKLSMVGW
jgi:hypothetical protein